MKWKIYANHGQTLGTPVSDVALSQDRDQQLEGQGPVLDTGGQNWVRSYDVWGYVMRLANG